MQVYWSKIPLCFDFHNDKSAALESPFRYCSRRASHSTIRSQRRHNFYFQCGMLFTSCLNWTTPSLYIFKNDIIKLCIIKQKIACITSEHLCAHCLAYLQSINQDFEWLSLPCWEACRCARFSLLLFGCLLEGQFQFETPPVTLWSL